MTTVASASPHRAPSLDANGTLLGAHQRLQAHLATAREKLLTPQRASASRSSLSAGSAAIAAAASPALPLHNLRTQLLAALVGVDAAYDKLYTLKDRAEVSLVLFAVCG